MADFQINKPQSFRDLSRSTGVPEADLQKANPEPLGGAEVVPEAARITVPGWDGANAFCNDDPLPLVAGVGTDGLNDFVAENRVDEADAGELLGLPAQGGDQGLDDPMAGSDADLPASETNGAAQVQSKGPLPPPRVVTEPPRTGVVRDQNGDVVRDRRGYPILEPLRESNGQIVTNRYGIPVNERRLDGQSVARYQRNAQGNYLRDRHGDPIPYMRNGNRPPPLESHRRGAGLEAALARAIHQHIPDEAVVSWGDPIGVHGPDVVSVNARTGQVTLWDTKHANQGGVDWNTPREHSGTWTDEKRRNKAIAMAIKDIESSNHLPEEVKERTVANLKAGSYTTATVAGGRYRSPSAEERTSRDAVRAGGQTPPRRPGREEIFVDYENGNAQAPRGGSWTQNARPGPTPGIGPRGSAAESGAGDKVGPSGRGPESGVPASEASASDAAEGPSPTHRRVQPAGTDGASGTASSARRGSKRARGESSTGDAGLGGKSSTSTDQRAQRRRGPGSGVNVAGSPYSDGFDNVNPESPPSSFVGPRAGTSGHQSLSAGQDGLSAELGLEASAGLYAEKNGSVEGEYGSASYTAQAKVEARAEANGSATAGANGVEARARAGASVSVEASVRGSAETKSVKVAGVDCNASVEGGARVAAEASAEAEGGVQVTRKPPTVVAEGNAGASAVVKAEADVTASAGPFSVTASGYASAGAEAQAEGAVGFKDGKVVLKGGLGAAVGVGLGGDVNVEVDVKQLGTMAVNTVAEAPGVKQVAAATEEGAKAVANGTKAVVSGAAEKVKGWFS